MEFVLKKKYVLYGHNISYSLSPIIHKLIAEYYEVELEYTIKDLATVDDVLADIKDSSYAGANITMPYKVSLFDKVDEVKGVASECLTINTIKIEDSKLIGYNTDAQGFLDVFDINDYRIKDKRVLVYGTGGAARGIVNALLDAGAKTVLLEGRTPQNKVELFRIFEKKADEKMTMIYGLQGLISDIVINATVLGSEISPELSIDIEKLDTKAVYDIVYNPMETELIKIAKEQNIPYFTGIEMLICQAIRAFYIWYPEFHREDINMKLFNFIKNGLEKNSDIDFKG